MNNKQSSDALTLELLKLLKEMTQNEREELLCLWKRETLRAAE